MNKINCIPLLLLLTVLQGCANVGDRELRSTQAGAAPLIVELKPVSVAAAPPPPVVEAAQVPVPVPVSVPVPAAPPPVAQVAAAPVAAAPVRVRGGEFTQSIPQPEKLDVTVPKSLGQLAKGNAVYYVPKGMTVGKASRVDLWIDSAASVEELQRALAQQLGLVPGTVKINVQAAKGSVGTIVPRADVYVGTNMTAQLRGGNDFDIDPPGPIHKSLRADGRAMWNWEVVPKNTHHKKRVLVIDAWVDLDVGKDAFNSIHEEIVVSGSWWQEGLDYLVSTTDLLNKILALLGVVGALWALFRKRLKKRRTPGRLAGFQAHS